jgi:hypothetical protein
VLSPYDDLPLHQSAEPIAYAGTSDRNAYERYFFNGYDREGDLFFAAALGVYANREVIDAAFSVLRDGVQRSVHASGRLGRDRVRTSIGPIRIDVQEPLRILALSVDASDLGVTADLTFTARTPAVEEPRFRLASQGRTVFDYTRLTQWGTWNGSLTVDDHREAIVPERYLGCRDRSWGIRPVGEPVGGAPAHQLPQFFWLWAPLHFDDRCVHFDVNEHGDGRRWHDTGMIVPLLGADPSPDDLADESVIDQARAVDYTIEWEPGTRRSKRAALDLAFVDGRHEHIEMEPILTFMMRGLGYLSPDWNHGSWKGEQHEGVEEWRIADLDPTEPGNIHVQQLVRANWGDREGVGVFEQLAINAHAPTGLDGLLDGARP